MIKKYSNVWPKFPRTFCMTLLRPRSSVWINLIQKRQTLDQFSRWVFSLFIWEQRFSEFYNLVWFDLSWFLWEFDGYFTWILRSIWGHFAAGSIKYVRWRRYLFVIYPEKFHTLTAKNSKSNGNSEILNIFFENF